MMAVVIIAALMCAVLPNAAVVILVAPLIISICRQMELDFVQPVILLVFAANSAGLLTLVGDPATFIVGSAIRLSFTDYLELLSPGGVLAILAVVAVLPLIFRSVWRTRMMGDMALAPARIDRPWVMLAYLVVLAVIIALFVFGETLPNPIAPPGVALVGAAMGVADRLLDGSTEFAIFFETWIGRRYFSSSASSSWLGRWRRPA